MELTRDLQELTRRRTDVVRHSHGPHFLNLFAPCSGCFLNLLRPYTLVFRSSPELLRPLFRSFLEPVPMVS